MITGAAQPSRLRIGVVGAGSVAERHLRASRTAANVEMAGIADTRPEQAEALSDAFGVPYRPTVDSLLSGPELDAVIVAVPTAQHAQVAVSAARAGLHVLCEKPMATNLRDCDAIIDACREAGVKLGGCQVMQHHHARLAGAKELVDEGGLGQLIAMHVRRCGDYRRTQRSAWKLDPSQAGGGVMLNHATYAIDEFLWFAGAPVRRVTARIAQRADDGIETEGMAILEFTNGVSATLVELGTDMPGSEEMQLIFTGGSLAMSGDDGLWAYRGGAGTQVVEPVSPRTADGERAMVAQLVSFADAVLRDRTPDADGPWQRSIVAVALALYESARTGDPALLSSVPAP